MEASPRLDYLRPSAYLVGSIAAIALAGCGGVANADRNQGICAVNRAVLTPEDQPLKVQIPTEDIQTVTVRNNGDGFTLTTQPTSPDLATSSSKYHGDHAEKLIGNTVIKVASAPSAAALETVLTICARK